MPSTNSTTRPPKFQHSQALFSGGGASSSRPFLSAMGHESQSLLEEEEGENENIDLEPGGRGQSTIFHQNPQSHEPAQHHVAWNEPEAAMNNVNHANVWRDNPHPPPPPREQDSSDDEVPQSFMIEASSRKHHHLSPKGKAKENKASLSFARRAQPLHSAAGRKLPPVLPMHNVQPPVSIPPRPSELDADGDKPSHFAGPGNSHHSPSDPHRPPRQLPGLDPYERALWNWVNVYNLDAFLQEVYYYYEGKGIYSIALARGLNLLTVGFVIGFSTFLWGCIDYSRIRPEKVTRLSDVIVSQCVSKFSGFTLMFFILFTAFYIWQTVSFVFGIFRLVDMYHFYTHLLKIPDADIQTISWPEVVRRISTIRQENPLTALSASIHAGPTNDATTAKLDAHDIANRIMRQENYLIALFNKELLDLRVPLPRPLKRFFIEEEAGKGKMLTKALEWNLRFCLMEYLFDTHGRVRKVFLKSRNRGALIDGLKRRFIFMGILNAIFAPFIVPYLLMYSFFRYFEEYHKNPSSIGGRRYTPFAQWKFREFNELPHLFARRLDESHPLASMYIGQFPNEKVALIMRFVAFVAGSFAAVLALASILDPDLIVHFELTPHRTVLFYLGVFGTVLAVARGMIPDENRVFDPEMLMTEVITYTHYMPDDWKGELHSKKVHAEFGELFTMKIMIFAQELVSVLLTPYVLWLSLPACAPAIIDFFREFSVHVEGRGYVCSFAEFNFERHGNVKFGAPTRIHDQKMVSNQGKMEKSFLNFKAANPDWNPTDVSGSLYLSRMADFSAAHANMNQYSRRRPGLETSNAIGERLAEGALADRAQEYDKALKQSQHAAVRRRHGGGNSTFLGAGSTMEQSTFGGMSTAQSVALGESDQSVNLIGLGGGPPAVAAKSTIAQDDLAPDGGVGSGLGESYVDGAKKARPFDAAGDEEGEEILQDGGVVGLLAQIYGARVQGGPSRVMD